MLIKFQTISMKNIKVALFHATTERIVNKFWGRVAFYNFMLSTRHKVLSTFFLSSSFLFWTWDICVHIGSITFFFWQPSRSFTWDQCTTISAATGTPILDTLGFPCIVTFHWMVTHPCSDPDHSCLTSVTGWKMVKPCHHSRVHHFISDENRKKK